MNTIPVTGGCGFVGSNLVKKLVEQKIHFGSVLVYSASTFSYVYHIIGLTYVSAIKNDIYGLHYDIL
jgi:dTDP-D-glucose 4,6-dehydratase